MEKAREFQKNIYFCFIDYAKAFDCVDHHKLWEILQEMGIADHLTCLLRNPYSCHEEKVRMDMEQQTGSKLGKEYVKGVYCHPAYLTYIQSSVQSLSHVRLCDPMDCSMPSLPVYHQLLEFTQTPVHQVSDAIQPSHPLSSPSPPAPNPSQHQSLFQ